LIPLSIPCLAGNERRYVDECIDTNFVSSVGPFVTRFEKEFAAYVGARHAVACASGTAALHVAFRLLGVSADEEVFVADFTFAASANAICYEHGNPVFVDSERASWNMDPALIVEELERRASFGIKQPRAVEVVHILGHPADISLVLATCARYDVPVVEDAAEALGARYVGGAFEGRHVGTLGRVGCFSFNGNKILTTGGGGMLVTDDEHLARRAKHLTTQARLPGVEYDHDEVGYNYRLTNVAAAIGVAQLERLDSFIATKTRIAARYDTALSDVPGIILPPRQRWARSTVWLYSILVDEARFGISSRALIQRLAEASIEARPLWRPLNRTAPFRRCARLGGHIADDLFRDGVSIPCSVGLTDADQDHVIATIRLAYTGSRK
jgi:dTDP-4-amino-4,6-dideoxygalactose transaminase